MRLAAIALAFAAICGVAHAQPIANQNLQVSPWYEQGPHVYSATPTLPTLTGCGSGAAVDAESNDNFGAVVTGSNAMRPVVRRQASSTAMTPANRIAEDSG